MRLLTATLSLLAAAAALPAQTTVRLPLGVTPTPPGNNIPIAGSPMRYQQWFANTELETAIGRPVRITRMAFLADSVTQAGTYVDMDVRMAHMDAGRLPSSNFDLNLTRDAALVLPRSQYVLVPQPARGARVVTLTFSQPFTWDAQSSLVFDVRVYGNGSNNQSYNYNCQNTTFSLNKTMRLFAIGNPASLTRATVIQNGNGLLTEFDFEDGATVPFGDACPGAGNVYPEATTLGGLPIVPNPQWRQLLSNAGPGLPVVLLIGAARDNYNGATLPFDLGLFGFTGCYLNVAPLVFLNASTSGSGGTSILTPLPGFARLRGKSLFMQWLIANPQAPNGVLAATVGLWHALG